jgi:hypothetical protein
MRRKLLEEQDRGFVLCTRFPERIAGKETIARIRPLLASNLLVAGQLDISP